MTTQELLEMHSSLDNELTEASNKLGAVTKGHVGAMGLLDDEIKLTVEYRVARDEYNRAFKKLRDFNQVVYKNKEYQKARYAQIMTKRFANVK